MVNALDAISMAIFMFEGAAAHSPSVRNVRNNNPGNLRPFKGTQVTDSDNYRTFPTFAEGWAALQDDIRHKLSFHLKPDSTMVDLFNIYAPGADHNDPKGYAQFVCNWMSAATNKSITVATPIAQLFSD